MWGGGGACSDSDPLLSALFLREITFTGSFLPIRLFSHVVSLIKLRFVGTFKLDGYVGWWDLRM